MYIPRIWDTSTDDTIYIINTTTPTSLQKKVRRRDAGKSSGSEIVRVRAQEELKV
jgi:hypothetical protein